ncbi:MAG TPA: ATP-binding protein [Candidatus Binatia bacterium]|jgi:signal transduction histidine kinase/DNA-binding response OmpR family regulator|nr:ATP-binding protein [Candidatus Binatia bacterium]
MLYRIRHGIIGPLAIFWLTVTVASVVMGAVAWNRFSRSIDASAEAEQFRESIDQLFSVLQDAEASQRGYLLTGNASYLEAFTNAARTFPETFARLVASAKHDPAAREDLYELRPLIELELAELREATVRRGAEIPAASRAAAGPDQARTTMDRIRELSKRRHDTRLDLLSATGESTRREMKLVHQMTWVAGLLGIGAGLFSLYFYRIDYYQERSRRELLEEKLHAEQAVREKSAFLANMSHEIRSPMNAILGFSELLEPEGLTPKQSQYVRAIRDSGASLLQLINDILDLSKLEAGKLELHPDPTDLRDSCEFLRTVFGQQAVMKSLQLQFELSPNLPRALLLDRLRLRQVLVNLLSNAIKFTDRGCVKTRVSWERLETGTSGTLLIDVEDTGIGIPADKLDEVFKPFVQADSRQRPENDGTGIGLTIVKRLTELMGGSLSVESKVGQGTVFHLRFTSVPVSGRLPVGDHAEPSGAVDFNDFAPATLLVVDDNQANRALMAGIFEKTHHQVHFATNGQEALECLGKEKPDVVLLDLRMPVMDGRTTLAAIRKQPSLASLPVIAVTASSKAGEEQELQTQFSGYIRKPFSRHTLFLALAQFLQPATRETARHLADTARCLPLPSSEQAAQWQELTLELRRQEASEWPTLRDSLAVNATRTFAHNLFTLGQAARCDSLATYAASLTTFADAYAIGEMERQLAAFPKLVESIETSLTQAQLQPV